MPRFSLRQKLLATVALILLPVAVLLVREYDSDLRNATRTVLDGQMQTAQTTALLIDATFSSLEDVAWSFAKDPVILTFDPAQIDPYLRQFASLYPDFNSIVVFDSTGGSVGSMLVEAPPRPTAADCEYFRQVMATNAPYISNLFISRVTDRPIALSAVPIRGEEGTPIGVVFASFDVEVIPRFLAPVGRRPDQNVFIADRTGRLAYHSAAPELSWEERDVSANPVMRQVLSAGEFLGVAEPLVPLRTHRLLAATRAPESGWVAGISASVETTLAPVQNDVTIGFAAYGAILLLSFLVALWLAERMVRPVRRLAEHAIALGRGRLWERANIVTGDELETVGASLDAMADEIRRSTGAREEFLMVASQELRAPLGLIRQYAQFLLQRKKEESDRAALATIVRSVERMEDLIRDMLEISKIRTEGVRLEKERFNLAALTRDVAARLQQLAPRHRLNVRAERPVEVYADRAKLEMVLGNLIDNAIRYSPEGGDVDIEVEVRGREAVVTVTDHGLGIPRAKQKYVLQPFFQVYPALAGFGGMGLGLYISKHMVEGHGGRIWFESEEGKGASFHFSLPLE